MQLSSDQVAVVTGAASGIGLALAGAFVARGLKVVLADIEAQCLQAAAADVGGHPVVTDVSRRESVDALAEETLRMYGRVDVVCNNAGVALGYCPTWELDATDWDWVLGVNLMGVIHGVAAFVPHLVRQGTGHVVNTSSAAGLGVIPGLAPYDVAKHGVEILSEVLRAELTERAAGVGVTVVSPGMVRTGILTSDRNRPDDLRPASGSTQVQDVDGNVPMAEPDVVAAKVLAAIEANRLHVALGAGGMLMKARLEQLEHDIAVDALD